MYKNVLAILIWCVLLKRKVNEFNEFYLWERNHKDKIRFGVYIQVVELLLPLV